MRKILLPLAAIVAFASLALGQKGTAEPDYYPMGYSGDTWTGEVTQTNDATREITLTFSKKDKTQTFIGALEEGYKVKMKDGSFHELKVSEIPAGTRIKVYYMMKEEKASGAKAKVNKIFKIKFLPKEDK